MYIIVSDATFGRQPWSWHVGEACPVGYDKIDSVVEVQADGDELSYIIRRFTNLPYPVTRSARWFGDMAKFIVGNLK